MLWKFILIIFCWQGTAFAAPAKTSDFSQSLNPPNKKTIQWMVHDLPPFIYTTSPDAVLKPENVQGPLAGLYKVLASSMPQYEHRFVRIPLLRLVKLIKEDKQICSLLLAENQERHSFLYFGEEVTVGLPFGLITLQSISRDKYVLSNPAINEVDMKRTLENKKFRLGFATGRFHPPALTPLIAKDPNTFGFHSDGSITKLLAMLQAQRIDGVLAVYLEMAEYERANPQSEKMRFMRMKEAPEFTALRATCEKTPWGRRALKDISKVVREKSFKELSNDYLVSVLPTERRKEYLKIYESRPKVLARETE